MFWAPAQPPEKAARPNKDIRNGLCLPMLSLKGAHIRGPTENPKTNSERPAVANSLLIPNSTMIPCVLPAYAEDERDTMKHAKAVTKVIVTFFIRVNCMGF
jgi:hypothetical protein